MASPLLDISVFSCVQHNVRLRNGGSTPPSHHEASTDVGNGGATTLRSLYLDFLNDMCFVHSPAACNPELEAICRRLSAICSAPTPIITMSAALADLCYRYHPLHIKVQIAHFTALIFCVDDLSGSLKAEARHRFLQDLTLFYIKFSDPQGYSKLYPGRGGLHPILEETIVFLKSEWSPFFGTDNRLHGQLVTSILDFLEANLLEQHYDENPVELTGVAEMRLIPCFIRRKSGISEPYAHFIIMNTSASGPSRTKHEERFFYNKLYPLVPEMVGAVEYINDVLSFYKEERTGEVGVCILDDARIHGISPVEAFAAYAQYVVNARTRVVALVEKAESAEMKKRVLQFFQGYLSWHVGNKRYRLHEVLPEGWYSGQCFP